MMGIGDRIEAVREVFGGASSGCDASVRNKVGSAYVIQVAERIEEDMHQMEWKTFVEVAKILPDGATVF